MKELELKCSASRYSGYSGTSSYRVVYGAAYHFEGIKLRLNPYFEDTAF
jgi:hypothetical protein